MHLRRGGDERIHRANRPAGPPPPSHDRAPRVGDGRIDGKDAALEPLRQFFPQPLVQSLPAPAGAQPLNAVPELAE